MSRLRKNRNKDELALLHRRISRHTRKPVLAERQLIMRSKAGTAIIKLPRIVQAAGLVASGAFLAWVVHVSYAYVSHDQIKRV